MYYWFLLSHIAVIAMSMYSLGYSGWLLIPVLLLTGYQLPKTIKELTPPSQDDDLIR
jgi:hypothetical protein